MRSFFCVWYLFDLIKSTASPASFSLQGNKPQGLRPYAPLQGNKPRGLRPCAPSQGNKP
jgi:hypothetical protein